MLRGETSDFVRFSTNAFAASIVEYEEKRSLNSLDLSWLN